MDAVRTSAVTSWDCSQPRVTHYNGDIMLGGSNILMMISILDFLLFFLNTLFILSDRKLMVLLKLKLDNQIAALLPV